MTPEDIRQLYDYNAWANRRSLDAAAALSTEQFTKPLGSSFSSVRDTLAHIWGCEWLWLERFQGRSPASLPDVNEFNELSALQTRWQEDETRLQQIRCHAYPGRFESRPRIPHPEFWRVQESAVAIHAAYGESRNLSSRADRDHAPAVGRQAAFQRLDSFLSRALHRCEAPDLRHSWKSFELFPG